MNLKPISECPKIVNKEYLVYDANDGFAVATCWKDEWRVCVNSELDFYLSNVTHFAELPPNPLA